MGCLPETDIRRPPPPAWASSLYAACSLGGSVRSYPIEMNEYAGLLNGEDFGKGQADNMRKSWMIEANNWSVNVRAIWLMG